MAQNITLLGASYSDVPAVTLPKTGGGTASFFDVSDTTAAAADVASGKYFYTSAGAKTQGTASGGGSSFTLLSSTELAVNTTSTTAASAGTIELGSSAYTKDKILYVRVRDKSGKRDGYFYGSDAYFMNYIDANGATSTLSVGITEYYRYSGGALTGTSGQYGVYGYSITSAGKLTIRRRYSSNGTLTINSTYTIDVYLITPPKALFS